MKTEFNNRFNQLEAKRKKIFKELKSYSDDDINKKPDSQTWSVVEIIDHLIAADKASLMYLQKKTLGVASAEKSGFKELLGFLILKTAFILPIKFKAPTVTTPTLSNFTTLKELDAKWDVVKSDTLSLLNKLSADDFKKNLWNHPTAGKMNLVQMITFTAIHFDRHKQQINRTLKSIKK